MSDPYAAFGRPVDAAPAAPAPRAAPRPQSYRPSYTGALPTDANAVFPFLVNQESGGRAGVIGPETPYGRAIGRTQMLPETAREMATKLGVPFREDLLRGTSPDAAAYQDRLGMAYFQQGLQQTGNMRDALHYYHGGPDRRLWGPKTRAYADSILSNWAAGQGQPQQPQGAADAGADPFAAYGRPVVNDAAAAEATATYGTSAPAVGEVVVDRGVQNINGRAVERGGGQPDKDLGPWDQYFAGLEQSRQERIARMERESNPEYQAQYDRAQNGIGNVPDVVAQVLAGQTLGGNGIVPYLTGAVSYVDAALQGQDAGLASQAARDATRDHMDTFAQEHPGQSLGYQLLGGLFTPGLKGAGDYIGAAQGAERIGRAAVVGGGMGAASGVLNATGDAGNRVKEGLLGGAVGAATAGALDLGAQRAFSGAARAIESPSGPRLLSRRGIDLTPAQMVSEVPGLGGLARKAEDVAAGYLPFVQSARNRSIEGFDRAVINEALGEIGQTLPKGVSGREAIREGSALISQAYRDALGGVTVTPDQEWSQVLEAALNPSNLSRQARRTLSDLTADLRTRFAEPISGDDWKQIDSELSGMIASAQKDNASRPVANSLREIRAAFEAVLDRSAPGSLERKRAADAAYANFERIRKAAANPTTARNEGLFTSSNLNSVLARTENRAYGMGEARLQGLTDVAENVLPPTLGDTGSGQRAILGALAVGGQATGLLAPQVAVPIIATGVAYSKPAQAALNVIYRSTDRGAVRRALGELARFAGRNPALQPYYQAAVSAGRSLFEHQEAGSAPTSAGLLAPNPARQTAG